MAQRILDWARGQSLTLRWGKGAVLGTCYLRVDKAYASSPFGLWTPGTIEIHFGYLRNIPPYNLIAQRRELLRQLNAIPGVSLDSGDTERFPNFSLAALTDRAALDQFLRTMSWVVEEVRKRQLTPVQAGYRDLWKELVGRLQREKPGVKRRTTSRSSWLSVPIGISSAHLEWVVHGRAEADRWFEVGLHLEHRDRQKNLDALRWLEGQRKALEGLVGEKLSLEEWGKRWARVYARYDGVETEGETREWALKTMIRFYDALVELDVVAQLRQLGW